MEINLQSPAAEKRNRFSCALQPGHRINDTTAPHAALDGL
jgi:hypothetical protein